MKSLGNTGDYFLVCLLIVKYNTFYTEVTEPTCYVSPMLHTTYICENSPILMNLISEPSVCYDCHVRFAMIVMLAKPLQPHKIHTHYSIATIINSSFASSYVPLSLLPNTVKQRWTQFHYQLQENIFNKSLSMIYYPFDRGHGCP